MFRNLLVFFLFILTNITFPERTAGATEPNAIDFLLDPDRKYDEENLPSGLFRKYDKAVPNFGFYDGVVWLRFNIQDTNSQRPVLEIKNPNLDIIRVFERNGTEKKFNPLFTEGDYFPYSQRKIDHRFFQFPIDPTDGLPKEILLKIDNHGDQLYIPISVSDKEKLASRDYGEQYLFGIYYGILLFVFLLNLFIYLVIKERENLYYVWYLLGLIFLQLGLSGFGFQYLWKDSPYLANHTLPFLASFTAFSIIKFTQWFLNTQSLIPSGHRILNGISWIASALMALSLIQSEALLRISIVSINVLIFMLNFAIILVAVLAVKLKFKPARFFLVAFILLALSVFALILRNFGIAPSNFFTDYSLQIGTSCEIILLSFAVVDKFKTFRDESVSRLQEMNLLKSEQNVLLEEQVKERTHEINNQKEKLAEKNKEITDSITYAKRIQNAILPPVECLDEFASGSFIFYLPKDIVAGDFYWIEKTGNKVIFAVADCTGHGVPGALVSVVCNNALNRAVREFGVTEPAGILDKVSDLVIDTFRKSTEGIHDGMDIALCSLDLQSNQIEFAGANNPLYVISNGILTEIKGDKQPIGEFSQRRPFTNHALKLNKGDSVYIFSDGFADQFGGPEGKKLMYRPFKQLLAESSTQPAFGQRVSLEAFFNEWKGSLEQVDDVCVIGLRI